MVAAEMRRKKLRSGTQEVVVEDSDEQFIKNEVDPILDKITAQGIHSLTARERKILENARKKMSGS
jgi:predicted DNA binding protein